MRSSITLVAALVLSLLMLSPFVLRAQGTSTVVLEVRGERLTLRAVDAPLAAILQRLTKNTGIPIRAEEPVQERVSVDLTDVSLEEGMRRVLKHWNTLFLYNRSSPLPVAIYLLGPRGGALPPLISQPTQPPLTVSEAAEYGEMDVEADRQKTDAKIQDLEETLHVASVAASSEAFTLLQDLMAHPEPSVRITALQWFAGQQGTGVDALVKALLDRDDLMQRVATQLVLDRGVDELAVEEIRAAAEAQDERALHQMLSSLLSR